MDIGEGEETANAVPAGPEYFSMDTGEPAVAEEYQGPEHDLDDGPVERSETRFKTPERKPATKRRGEDNAAEAREGEPAKNNQCFEIVNDEGDGDQDSSVVQAKLEDERILHHAMLGHDLTEVYSNKRLQLAGSRQFVESILSTDISEVFSPERVTSVCARYGFVPGQAMDIKNGYDFDLAKDRKKAWESVLADKPKLIIGSPPCTFSVDCRSSISTCTRTMNYGWPNSVRVLSRQNAM